MSHGVPWNLNISSKGLAWHQLGGFLVEMYPEGESWVLSAAPWESFSALYCHHSLFGVVQSSGDKVLLESCLMSN